MIMKGMKGMTKIDGIPARLARQISPIRSSENSPKTMTGFSTKVPDLDDRNFHRPRSRAHFQKIP
jgi:hypothetical protein